MNFRKMSVALLSFMMLTTIAFASGSDEAEADTGPVELRYTLWSGNEAHLALFRGIADDYVREHPNVTVEYQTIPHGSYLEKITLQASGSDAPDAGWLFERAGTAFIDAGALVDLRGALGEWDFDDFSPAIISLWQRGDAVYGVPFSTSPMVMFYNADMYREAGVPTPDELQAAGEWTWERFREIARTIREETGNYAYAGPGFDDTPIRVVVPILRAYGARVWDAQQGNATINNAAAVEAIQLYHDMLFEDESIVPPGNLSDFFAGDVATNVNFISRASLLTDVDWEWGIAKLPAGPAGQPGVIGQSSIVAFSASDHPEVAADFVAFMTNKENMAKLSEFFPPSRVSVLESEGFVNGNPNIPADLMEDVIVPSMQAGEVLPVHEEYANLLLTAQPHLDRLWRSDANVKGVLDSLAADWEPILQSN